MYIKDVLFWPNFKEIQISGINLKLLIKLWNQNVSLSFFIRGIMHVSNLKSCIESKSYPLILDFENMVWHLKNIVSVYSGVTLYGYLY